MRRIALFSDIHGNSQALESVLDDIEASGPEEVYCLGDLVGYGPDPVGAVERVRGLDIAVIRGNYDRGVGGRLGDCGCHYVDERARADGKASYHFTVAALAERDLAWLYDLPDHLTLYEGKARILLTHGSPRKINEYLLPDRSDEQLTRLARDAAVDVVCVGHVHIPYHRCIESDEGPIHYVSSGSVGKPKDGDPRAAWVELVLGSEEDVTAAAPGDDAVAPAGISDIWVGTVTHRVHYDVDAVGAAMLDAGLPHSLAEALRGA